MCQRLICSIVLAIGYAFIAFMVSIIICDYVYTYRMHISQCNADIVSATISGPANEKQLPLSADGMPYIAVRYAIQCNITTNQSSSIPQQYLIGSYYAVMPALHAIELVDRINATNATSRLPPIQAYYDEHEQIPELSINKNHYYSNTKLSCNTNIIVWLIVTSLFCIIFAIGFFYDRVESIIITYFKDTSSTSIQVSTKKIS